jgi:hypothetical protein
MSNTKSLRVRASKAEEDKFSLPRNNWAFIKNMTITPLPQYYSMYVP